MLQLEFAFGQVVDHFDWLAFSLTLRGGFGLVRLRIDASTVGIVTSTP
jgi:hypothetical protein